MSDAIKLFLRRLVVSLLLAGVVIFFVVKPLVGRIGKRPPPPTRADSVVPPIAVRTLALQPGTHTEKISGFARARPLREARLMAEAAGIVRWVRPGLEAGTTIREKEELFRLDPRDAQQSLLAADAQVARAAADKARLVAEIATSKKRLAIARTERELAADELARLTELSGRSAATKSEVDRQRLQVSLRESAMLELAGRLESLAAQQARVVADASQAAVAVATATLAVERTTIKAPWDGRVTTRLVEKGDRVAPGSVLADLIDPRRVEIAIALPGARYRAVLIGATVTLQIAGGGTETWTTKIVRRAPAVSQQDRTFLAYCEIEVDPPPPGAFLTAEVASVRHENVFAIPRTAVVRGVVHVARNGVAHARRLDPVAALTDTVLVRTGFSAGERLIISNLEEVAAGTRISDEHTPAAAKDDEDA